MSAAVEAMRLAVAAGEGARGGTDGIRFEESLGKATAGAHGCEMVEVSESDRPSTGLAASHEKSAALPTLRPDAGGLGARECFAFWAELEQSLGIHSWRSRLGAASTSARGDRCSGRVAGRTDLTTGSLLSSGTREKPSGPLRGERIRRAGSRTGPLDIPAAHSVLWDVRRAGSRRFRSAWRKRARGCRPAFRRQGDPSVRSRQIENRPCCQPQSLGVPGGAVRSEVQ